MELTGTWRAAVADDDLRRTWHGRRLRRRRLGAVEVPGHWRSTPAFADADGPLLYRRSFDAMAPGRGPPRLAHLRRHLLPRRRLARRRLPRRHRGLLRPAHLRGHRRRSRARGEHHLAVEVTCTPAGRPHGQAQPHRRVPALGLPRPRLEPRRHLAAGAHRRRPGRCASRRLRVLCREATAERAVARAAGRRSTATPPAPSALRTHARRARARSRPAARRGRERGRVDGHRRPARAVVAAGARRADRCTTCTSQVVLDADEGGHRPDERHLRTGLRQVAHARAGSLGQRRAALPQGLEPGPDPHGPGRGHARGARRRRRAGRATPGSTSCGSTPTSPGPSSTTPPTRPGCCCGRTSRCSGATPAASASRPCARPRAAVDLLGHHPSIAIWCGHNEPMAIENDPAMWGDPKALRRMAPEGGSPPRSCRPGTRRCSTAR